MKKIAKLLVPLILIFAFFIFSQCCEQICNKVHPYLVLYAFDTEGELLAEKMEIDRSDTLLGRVVHIGVLSGKDIVLAESGVGMANAAMATQKMIDKYNPEAVIFSGIAGAIDTSVHIGDIVVCEKWATHDYGYIGGEGFQAGGVYVKPFGTDSMKKITYFAVDSALYDNAKELGASGLIFDSVGNRVPDIKIGGHGVSGNQFIDQVEKRLWLSENFGALVVDMETAAVAQVCAVNGVPFIGIRSASDLAGGSGSESAQTEIEQFFKVAAFNSAKVVIEYLRNL